MQEDDFRNDKCTTNKEINSEAQFCEDRVNKLQIGLKKESMRTNYEQSERLYSFKIHLHD